MVNPQQAAALLTSVEKTMDQLTAFFAVMYYSALRPAEAVDLTADEIDLPGAENGDEGDGSVSAVPRRRWGPTGRATGNVGSHGS